jgi:platelet-activating factor acetylhydrolase
MEIEVPVSRPQTFYPNKSKKCQPLHLDTVLMAVYYPATLGTGHGEDPAGYKKWSRLTWLPRPRLNSAKGYARFGGSSLAIPWILMTACFTKLPAFRNAKLATHWPLSPENKRRRGEEWQRQGPAPDGELSKPCCPLMIFSHGLGGSRTCYSSICGEVSQNL